MKLIQTEPTARVATSKASKTWRDNAKTEGHYKRKKREENVVIAFRKRFLWHALDPAVRKAKEPRIGATYHPSVVQVRAPGLKRVRR